MRRRSNIKSLVLIMLVVAIVGMSVAYALLSTTLTITGNTSVSAASWDIHFEELDVYVDGNPSYTMPTLSNTSISDFEVVLTSPGDTVDFLFRIVNNGTIDAKITSLIKGTPSCSGVTGSTTGTSDASIVCNSLMYEFFNASTGENISVDDVLAAGEYVDVALSMVYDPDATELPVNDVAISNLDITVVYGQK